MLQLRNLQTNDIFIFYNIQFMYQTFYFSTNIFILSLDAPQISYILLLTAINSPVIIQHCFLKCIQFMYKHYIIEKEIFNMLSMLPLRLAIMPDSCSSLKSSFSPRRNSYVSFLVLCHQIVCYQATRIRYPNK